MVSQEDVPVNLLAVKAAAELLLATEPEPHGVDWEITETLGGYVKGAR
jgi:hypothetical protein